MANARIHHNDIRACGIYDFVYDDGGLVGEAICECVLVRIEVVFFFCVWLYGWLYTWFRYSRSIILEIQRLILIHQISAPFLRRGRRRYRDLQSPVGHQGHANGRTRCLSWQSHLPELYQSRGKEASEKVSNVLLSYNFINGIWYGIWNRLYRVLKPENAKTEFCWAKE